MGGRGSAGRGKPSGANEPAATPLPTEQVQPEPDAAAAEKQKAVNTRFTRFIHETVDNLARQPGDWVGVIDLRAELDARGVSREAQDAHLTRLSAEGLIHLVPESNRKALRAEDHAAAIRLGGDDCHLIAWARRDD